MIPQTDIDAARDLLGRSARILVICHLSPDGDAIGSLLGLGLALRAAGKDVTMACPDPVPETFRFLPHWEDITNAPQGAFDITIVVDTSDAGRVGALRAAFEPNPDIVFDHHVSNLGFGRINLLDTAAASTAEVLAALLAPLNLPMTEEAAACLLTGLVCDTQGFRTSYTSTRSLAATQRLMEAGASLYSISHDALHKRSFSAMRLWGEGLSTAKMEDGIVWAKLPLSAKRAAGYGGNGDADLADFLGTARDVKVAVLFVERPDGKIKISWRSVPGVNVARLAMAYGGGGHEPAAGAEIAGSMAEVEAIVLRATRELLRELSAAPKPAH
jgi:bifunctional oligoribonuclease and PAP phosphatase NrnA